MALRKRPAVLLGILGGADRLELGLQAGHGRRGALCRLLRIAGVERFHQLTLDAKQALGSRPEWGRYGQPETVNTSGAVLSWTHEAEGNFAPLFRTAKEQKTQRFQLIL